METSELEELRKYLKFDDFSDWYRLESKEVDWIVNQIDYALTVRKNFG